MKIQVAGIEVSTVIGCNPDERIKKQPLVFDLMLSLYHQDHYLKDSLHTTINYDELIDFIKAMVEKTSYQLLESLVQYITHELLKHYSLIKRIKITVTKLEICGVKAGKIQVSHTECRKHKIAIAFGSNLGMPKKQIISAIELLAKSVSDIQIGGFYETLPFGVKEQPNYVNTAIIGYTKLNPDRLFAKIKTIEKLLGKVEQIENGPRIIDVDLVFFSNWEYQYNFLQVPHPSCHLRDFVLKPLMDIEPDLIHPVLDKTISELYNNLEDRFIIGSN